MFRRTVKNHQILPKFWGNEENLAIFTLYLNGRFWNQKNSFNDIFQTFWEFSKEDGFKPRDVQ